MNDAAIFFLQAASAAADQARESQEGFWDFTIWLIIGVPLVIAIVLAWANKLPYQEVAEFDPGNFGERVLDSETPTLVHFYHNWSIGDQVMIAQVEKIASRARDFAVGFVDVGRHPQMLELFSHIEPPALLLFAGGERIFQCEGVFDEADVIEEVRDAITRWRRTTAADAASVSASNESA